MIGGYCHLDPHLDFLICKDMLLLTLHGNLSPEIIPQNSASQEVELISLKTEI